MAINPEQFYSYAHGLWARDAKDSAQLRTLISRAYYAALIVSAQNINESTQGSNTHSRIINRYKERTIDSTGQIADWLCDLRDLRVMADYKPAAEINCAQGDRALALCRKLLMKLNRLPPNKP